MNCRPNTSSDGEFSQFSCLGKIYPVMFAAMDIDHDAVIDKNGWSRVMYDDTMKLLRLCVRTNGTREALSSEELEAMLFQTVILLNGNLLSDNSNMLLHLSGAFSVNTELLNFYSTCEIL